MPRHLPSGLCGQGLEKAVALDPKEWEKGWRQVCVPQARRTNGKSDKNHVQPAH